jgi:hypothetical protein
MVRDPDEQATKPGAQLAQRDRRRTAAPAEAVDGLHCVSPHPMTRATTGARASLGSGHGYCDGSLHDHLGRHARRRNHATYREYLDPQYSATSTRAQQVQEPVLRPARHQRPHPQLGRRAPHGRRRARRHRRRGDLPEHRPAVLPDLRPGPPARRNPRTTSTGCRDSRHNRSSTSAGGSPSGAASARSSSTTSTTRSTT